LNLRKTLVFSDSTNQNGGNQMNPFWKKEGKNLTPCKFPYSGTLWSLMTPSS
jgi:hypothetical protein